MPGSTYSQNNWFFRWPDCPHPLYYPFPLPTHSPPPPNFQEEGKTFLGFALDTSYSNMTSFLTFPSLLNKMIFTKRKLDLKLTLCYWKHANPHHLWNQNSSLKLKYQASPKTHLQVPAFTLGAPFRPETLRRLCFRPSCTWARVLPLPTLSPAPQPFHPLGTVGPWFPNYCLEKEEGHWEPCSSTGESTRPLTNTSLVLLSEACSPSSAKLLQVWFKQCLDWPTSASQINSF